MKEIKFRGKSTLTGEWKYGIYMPETKNHLTAIGTYIEDGGYWDWEEVYPETVGQFTGLTDKNGKEIYEGDILDFDDGEWGGMGFTSVVIWDARGACWVFPGGMPSDVGEWRKIVGNIYDNSELCERI